MSRERALIAGLLAALALMSTSACGGGEAGGGTGSTGGQTFTIG